MNSLLPTGFSTASLPSISISMSMLSTPFLFLCSCSCCLDVLPECTAWMFCNDHFDVQSLPADVQKSAFRLFDCVGRGSLDFRNFCRALALCCRGSRDERLRFLYDLFSGASQAKYYGTGADTGPKDAPETGSGGAASAISEVCFSAAQWGVCAHHMSLDGLAHNVQWLCVVQ